MASYRDKGKVMTIETELLHFAYISSLIAVVVRWGVWVLIAQELRLWVRVPLKLWTFVRIFLCFAVVYR